MSVRTREKPRAKTRKQEQKRPYARPRIRTSDAFESATAACDVEPDPSA